MKIKMHSWDTNLFHVVGRTCGERPWPTSMEEAWAVFSQVFQSVHLEAKFSTHAFLLMSNHYHWLCQIDLNENLKLMARPHDLFNFEMICRFGGEAHHLLPSLPSTYPVNHITQYQTTYKYIYRNPVEAGLVQKVEDYPYSTLPHILGKPGLEFFCMDHMNLIYCSGKMLKWLNTGMSFD